MMPSRLLRYISRNYVQFCFSLASIFKKDSPLGICKCLVYFIYSSAITGPWIKLAYNLGWLWSPTSLIFLSLLGIIIQVWLSLFASGTLLGHFVTLFGILDYFFHPLSRRAVRRKY